MHDLLEILRRCAGWLVALLLAGAVLGILVRFVFEPLAEALLASPGVLLLLALVWWLWRKRPRL